MAPSFERPYVTQYDHHNYDGRFETFESEKPLYGQCKIFRKISQCPVELEICRILMNNPHPNCVMIYSVDGFCIDMEHLQTSFKILNVTKNRNMILRDMKHAIEHLNNFGIVYIDLKLDNIGWGGLSNSYKLFDFDMSGIVYLPRRSYGQDSDNSSHTVSHNNKKDSNTWLYAPSSGYVYRDYYKSNKASDISLFDIDQFALASFEKALF